MMRSKTLYVAALLLVACDKPSPPTPDDSPILLPANFWLKDVVTDDHDRTWFVLTPSGDKQGGSILCRLIGGEVGCGKVPVVPGSDEHGAHLLEPGPGARPLVALPNPTGAGGTRYVEPFTWRVVTASPNGYFQNGLVFADDTIVRDNSLELAPAGGQFRELEHHTEDHISRFGAVWFEHDSNDQNPQIVTATLGPTGLGLKRVVGKGEYWTKACRDGNTFGYIDLGFHQLVMLDLSSGNVQRIDITDPSDVFCRRGIVAAVPIFVPDSSSYICESQGCRAASNNPYIDGLMYEKITLVERDLMAVGMQGQTRIVTHRFGEEPHAFEMEKNCGRYSCGLRNTQLAMIPDGAIALYTDGQFVAFDNQGKPRQLTLTWVDPPATSP